MLIGRRDGVEVVEVWADGREDRSPIGFFKSGVTPKHDVTVDCTVHTGARSAHGFRHRPTWIRTVDGVPLVPLFIVEPGDDGLRISYLCRTTRRSDGTFHAEYATGIKEPS